ncbi:MAG: MFS transporter [Bacilli bacterium]
MVTSKNQRIWILILMGLSVFIIMLDGNVVPIALPVIMKDTHSSFQASSWVITSYVIAFTALLVPLGQLADKFGRRRIVTYAIVVFGLSSLLCGISWSLAWLLIGRVLQGIAGGVIFPASLAIIVLTFPKERRGTAIGVWGGISAIAAAIGPSIGGFVTHYLSWRWIFFLNIPITLFVLAMITTSVPESRGVKRSIPIFGGVLLGGTLTFLSVSLIQAPTWGWASLKEIECLAAFAVFLLVFIFSQVRSSNPVLPLSFFRRRAYSAANLVGVFTSILSVAVLLVLPFWLEEIEGFSALRASVEITPLAVAAMIAAPITGRLIDRVGARIPALAGTSILTVSILCIAYTLSPAHPNELIPFTALGGFGLGMSLIAISNAATADIDSERIVEGTAIWSMTRQAGFVVGICLVVTVLSTYWTINIGDVLNTVPFKVNGIRVPTTLRIAALHAVENLKNGSIGDPSTERFAMNGLTGLQGIASEFVKILHQMVADAARRAFRAMYLLIGFIGFGGIVASAFLPGKKSEMHGSVKSTEVE